MKQTEKKNERKRRRKLSIFCEEWGGMREEWREEGREGGREAEVLRHDCGRKYTTQTDALEGVLRLLLYSSVTFLDFDPHVLRHFILPTLIIIIPFLCLAYTNSVRLMERKKIYKK